MRTAQFPRETVRHVPAVREHQVIRTEQLTSTNTRVTLSR